MTYKICVDPGHGGSDPGASGNGLTEKTVNLSVAKNLSALLSTAGFAVVMTRTNDLAVALEDRAKIANGNGCTLFLSIHHNAGGGVGAEVYHSAKNAQDDRLAQLIIDEFVSAGQVSRGAKVKTSSAGSDYYSVLKNTNANIPSVITEYCFVDNKADAAKIDTPEKVEREAVAIYNAICRYFGVMVEPVKGDALSILAGKAGFDETHWRYMAEYMPSLHNLFDKIWAVWPK